MSSHGMAGNAVAAEVDRQGGKQRWELQSNEGVPVSTFSSPTSIPRLAGRKGPELQ